MEIALKNILLAFALRVVKIKRKTLTIPEMTKELELVVFEYVDLFMRVLSK